jgi:hypothetical protein
MLRIILLVVITYIVIRIALQLLLNESPMQRRSRGRGSFGARDGHPFFRGGHQHTGKHHSGQSHSTGHGRFEDIEDADFEEIPPRKPGEKPPDK